MPLLPVPLSALAGLALLAVPAAAQTAGRTAVMFEDFPGGYGGSAAKLVRQALERTGNFEIRETAGWRLRASSSAGRIDGALLAANGKVLFNNHYDWPDMRDNAAAFSDDIVEAITGGTGIAMSKIAFVSDRTGNKEIFLCDSDGGRVQQITRDKSVNVSPALGPGGLILMHTSYVSGFPDVYWTNLRDGETQRLISAPGTNSGAAFSTNGEKIALTMTHEGDPEIYVTTLNGTRSKRVTESRSVEFSPAWAPDGERIVFCSDATGAPQLYVVPRKGGEPERLATGVAKCTDPDWNADGRLIAFTAWNGSSRSVAVYELETGRTRMVLTGAGDPAWAPDGRHLVAVQNNELVVLHVSNGKKERIVTGMGRDQRARVVQMIFVMNCPGKISRRPSPSASRWRRTAGRMAAVVSCLALPACSALRDTLDGDGDDSPGMQSHPRRSDTPSLIGPGSSRLQQGTFPVVQFAADGWNLAPSETAKVRGVAQWLTGHPERVLVAAGARAESPEYARQLSDLRAQTVRRALISFGVPEEKVMTVSFGEDAPPSTGNGVSFSIIRTGETR